MFAACVAGGERMEITAMPEPAVSVPTSPDPLIRAADLLRGLGPEFAVWADRLDGLRQRREQGRFHLAVLGQFKRGKSTLLNALLGAPVLPTAAIPVTAVPTFVRHGTDRQIRIHFQGQREPVHEVVPDAAAARALLEQFVTETGNPHNRLGVEQVEVWWPAPVLARGVVLIDTPGVGSTFRHNTEATLNFLPQCDAALMVVSADPPITEVEVEFLKIVRSRVARMLFVLNKVDYLRPDDLEATLSFLRKVLTESVGWPEPVRIWCVSARQGLEARERGDEQGWRRSGLADLEHSLADLFASEKAAILDQAIRRKAADVLEEALMRLRLAMQALTMPLDDLERRMDQLEQAIAEAQRLRQAAADLLAGDHRRTRELLEAEAERLRVAARGHFEGVIQAFRQRDPDCTDEEVRAAMAEAVPGFFEHHAGRWTEKISAHVTEVLRPHQRRADELIGVVRKAAARLFDIPYRAPECAEAFELVRDPYWVTHRWASTLSPLPPEWFEFLLPKSWRERRQQRRWRRQVAELVMTNVENLRWSLVQSVDTTFRRFASALDERLAETIAATRGAIQAALAERTRQDAEVATQRERLAKAIADIEHLGAALVAGLSDARSALGSSAS